MKLTLQKMPALWAGALSLALVMLPHASGQQFPPLARGNFTLSAPHGFGDRQNSWPWTMEWFSGNLYAGTLRAGDCVYTAGTSAYPPTDPDVSCPTDPNTLPLQAEIWSWSPATNIWNRVFQSPQDLLIPGTVNQYVARDIGFRGMQVFTESDGTQALYVSGCSSKTFHPGLPGGRILRSADGVNFDPVPQDPGTLLGNLGNACFRGTAVYNGKFYVVTCNTLGNEGVLLEATDPKLGNNNFRIVSPAGVAVSEVGVYNGYLYATFSSKAGFTVAKTTAMGNPPYSFTSVIINAGYSTSPVPNIRALSLQQFNGDLYVGGESTTYQYGAELFRIHPDDTWDLLVGQSRSTPIGTKNALSGFKAGFSWQFNTALERMEVYDGRLYVGTFDSSYAFRFYNNPTFQSIVGPWMGFDFWVTADGVHWSPVDLHGFGEILNQGVRTLKSTPQGLFLGAANWFYGLEIWRGVP
jgi:hypothetical protein